MNVTVIDCTDHPPRHHVNVIIQGSKIVAITPAGSSPIGSYIVNGSGKFLIPGLWHNDLHGPSYDEAKLPLLSLISYGITTVRDMGAPLDEILRLRAATAAGSLVGPRLFVSGPLLQGPIPVKMDLIVDLFTEKEAREEVRSLKQHKVDYIELDTTLTPELYWAVADEAQRQDIPLVGHIPPTVSAWDMVKAKQIDIEHLGGRYLNVLVACSSDEAYFDQILRQTYEDLLIAANEKRPGKEPQFSADFDARLLSTFDEVKAQKFYLSYAQNGIAQTPTLNTLRTLWNTNKENHNLTDRDIEAGKKIFAKDLEVVAEMKRAGVLILAGTDGGYQEGGEALHNELELLVEAGLTPRQALQAASRDAARAVGASGDLGTIEVGKTADLVLLDSNPLDDISNTRKINAVVLHGRLFLKDELSLVRNR